MGIKIPEDGVQNVFYCNLESETKIFFCFPAMCLNLTKPAVDTEPKEKTFFFSLLVAASAEPDKLSLGGVSESRPLTIS